MDYVPCFLCLTVMAIVQCCFADNHCSQHLESTFTSLFQLLSATTSFLFSKKETEAQSPGPHSPDISNLNCTLSRIAPKSALEIVSLDCGWQPNRTGLKIPDGNDKMWVWMTQRLEDHEGERWNPRKSTKAPGVKHYTPKCPGPMDSSGS